MLRLPGRLGEKGRCRAQTVQRSSEREIVTYTVPGTGSGVRFSTSPLGRAGGVGGEVGRVHVATWAAPGVVCVLVEGEVDFCTLDQLAAPLRELVLADGVQVQLELAQLRFADVAAVGVLGCFARHVQHTGHRVRTRGAGSTLRKVASLLGVLDDLGLD